MMTRTTKNGRHLCRVLPLQADLVDAVNALREHVRKKQTVNHRRQAPPMFARDLVQFGSILSHWQEVVGRDVSEHAWPVHLIQGRLSLVCEDSQWLHHLSFLKSEIMQRLKTLLPAITLREIHGRVGPLPNHPKSEIPQPWPAWQQESKPELPPQVSGDLRDRISRCAQKAQARVKGFLARGFKICPVCHASVIPLQTESCGICVFRKREVVRQRIRVLLSESPWLSFEQVSREGGDASSAEYDIIRRDLILETRERIAILGPQWVDTKEPEIRSELEREIIREIMLASQLSPEVISLSDPGIQPLLDPEWIRWLNSGIDEEGAC